MARALPAEEAAQLWATARAGAVSVYPWDEWLDGRTWELTVGEDFPARPGRSPGQSIDYFRASAYQAAKARGLRVRTMRLDDSRMAVWCAGKLGEDAAATGPGPVQRIIIRDGSEARDDRG